MVPALTKDMKRMLIVLLLVADLFALAKLRHRSSTLDLASVVDENSTANPLTEFSDFDNFVVNWTRLNPIDFHTSHQVYWLEIIESAHCNKVMDQEMVLLEASHEYSWEPSQSVEIASYSHSFQSAVSGRLINQAAYQLSAEMQAHGCPAEDVHYELLLAPKFRAQNNLDQDAGDPDKIEITRSSNANLQTGNTHLLQNGMGSWSLSRGS